MNFNINLQTLKRFCAATVLASFTLSAVMPPPALAQNAPTAAIGLSPAFAPAVLKGVIVNAQDPFKFEFIVDQGTAAASPAIKLESTRLIKYFLAALTTPESDLWVNLSPYEKGRIVNKEFGATAMGRDLVAQDYLLKQVTASLLHPDSATGKAFWEKVYTQAYAKFGTIDIPVDTFNKVWITPDSATVYTNGPKAYIVDCKLKVMLESDYSGTVHAKSPKGKPPLQDDISKQMMRSIIIPVLENEVNTGANFAPLRQVYHSLILAAWFKRTLTRAIHESPLQHYYVNRQKIQGLQPLNVKTARGASRIDELTTPEDIWQAYVETFKKGVYNFIREESDPATGETIPRKYFSGGFTADSAQLDRALHFTAEAAGISATNAIIVDTNLTAPNSLKANRAIDIDPAQQAFADASKNGASNEAFLQLQKTVSALWDQLPPLDREGFIESLESGSFTRLRLPDIKGLLAGWFAPYAGHFVSTAELVSFLRGALHKLQKWETASPFALDTKEQTEIEQGFNDLIDQLKIRNVPAGKTIPVVIASFGIGWNKQDLMETARIAVRTLEPYKDKVRLILVGVDKQGMPLAKPFYANEVTRDPAWAGRISYQAVYGDLRETRFWSLWARTIMPNAVLFRYNWTADTVDQGDFFNAMDGAGAPGFFVGKQNGSGNSEVRPFNGGIKNTAVTSDLTLGLAISDHGGPLAYRSFMQTLTAYFPENKPLFKKAERLTKRYALLSATAERLERLGGSAARQKKFAHSMALWIQEQKSWQNAAFRKTSPHEIPANVSNAFSSLDNLMAILEWLGGTRTTSVPKPLEKLIPSRIAVKVRPQKHPRLLKFTSSPRNTFDIDYISPDILEGREIPLAVEGVPWYYALARLFSNANDFLGQTGNLAPSTPRMTVSARQERNRVVLDILLPGRIDDSLLQTGADGKQKIYELDPRREDFHHGVGSPFAARIFELMGGRITTSNVPSEGPHSVPMVRHEISFDAAMNASEAERIKELEQAHYQTAIDWVKHIFNNYDTRFKKGKLVFIGGSARRAYEAARYLAESPAYPRIKKEDIVYLDATGTAKVSGEEIRLFLKEQGALTKNRPVVLLDNWADSGSHIKKIAAAIHQEVPSLMTYVMVSSQESPFDNYESDVPAQELAIRNAAIFFERNNHMERDIRTKILVGYEKTRAGLQPYYFTVNEAKDLLKKLTETPAIEPGKIPVKMFLWLRQNDVDIHFDGWLERAKTVLQEFVDQNPQDRVREQDEIFHALLTKDAAQAAPGGIDLNPARLALKETGTPASIALPAMDASKVLTRPVEISGLVPVIMNIRPAGNLKELLTAAP